MVSPLYYELLRASPEDSLEEIKAAYHLAAKRNHPDLFPESERERHQMRMMQINEAYMAIVCDHSDGLSARPTEASEAPPPAAGGQSAPEAETRSLGQLKDPAYTYYKLGFRYFSEGRRTFFKRYMTGRQRIDFTTEHLDVLRLAVASLHFFHKAYTCFETVTREYGTSVWARDSEVKIYYLNRYNVIYQRICNNLSRKIARYDRPNEKEPPIAYDTEIG